MDDWIEELLKAVKEGLESLYGERLVGLHLFGSRARGEATAESDVDLLIVLDEVSHYSGEIERTSVLSSSISLRYDVSLSRVFASQSDWLHNDGPFFCNVRKDALAA